MGGWQNGVLGFRPLDPYFCFVLPQYEFVQVFNRVWALQMMQLPSEGRTLFLQAHVQKRQDLESTEDLTQVAKGRLPRDDPRTYPAVIKMGGTQSLYLKIQPQRSFRGLPNKRLARQGANLRTERTNLILNPRQEANKRM